MNRTGLFVMCTVFLGLLWGCRQEEQVSVSATPRQAALTIVAVGDSLTAGLGVAENDNYPTLLERQLQGEGHDVRVINAGVSGETTSGTLARIDWVLTLQPEIVILETGANDGLRGLDPGLVRANIRKIIERLEDKNIIVVLAGMCMVWNLGPVYTADFNRIYAEIAKEKGLIYMPFFLEGVATDPALNSEDGIHPNPQGYRVIVANLLPYVKEALAKAERAERP